MDNKLEKFTNHMIAKITNNLEKFNYNVIIANMYETYNFLSLFIKEKNNIKNLKDNYKKLLTCFLPIIPHFANECLYELCSDEKYEWPNFDKSILEDENIQFVLQINGKKRSIFNVKSGIKENELLEIVKKDNICKKYLINKNIKKIIFVQNRLMNILTNE